MVVCVCGGGPAVEEAEVRVYVQMYRKKQGEEWGRLGKPWESFLQPGGLGHVVKPGLAIRVQFWWKLVLTLKGQDGPMRSRS